jgi:hypothetical protein
MMRMAEPVASLELTPRHVRECFEVFAGQIDRRRFFRRGYLLWLLFQVSVFGLRRLKFI